jgi:hypothetical protein
MVVLHFVKIGILVVLVPGCPGRPLQLTVTAGLRPWA